MTQLPDNQTERAHNPTTPRRRPVEGGVEGFSTPHSVPRGQDTPHRRGQPSVPRGEQAFHPATSPRRQRSRSPSLDLSEYSALYTIHFLNSMS